MLGYQVRMKEYKGRIGKDEGREEGKDGEGWGGGTEADRVMMKGEME